MAALWEMPNLTGRYTEADAYRRFRIQSLLGQTLLYLNRFSEAEPLLLSGYEGLKQRVLPPAAAP
jgi:hypothetical protein